MYGESGMKCIEKYFEYVGQVSRENEGGEENRESEKSQTEKSESEGNTARRLNIRSLWDRIQ